MREMKKKKKIPANTINILSGDIVEKDINASLKNTHKGYRTSIIVCACSALVCIASIFIYKFSEDLAICLQILSGISFVGSLQRLFFERRKINLTHSYSHKIVRCFVTGTDWINGGEDADSYFLCFGNFKFEVPYLTYKNAVSNKDEYFLLFLVWEDSTHELINIYSCENYTISPELQITE